MYERKVESGGRERDDRKAGEKGNVSVERREISSETPPVKKSGLPAK